MEFRFLPFHDPFHGHAVDRHCVAAGLDGPDSTGRMLFPDESTLWVVPPFPARGR